MNRTAARNSLPALVALAGLCLLALGLAACNVNPEKSPAFIALQNRVKALEDQQKKNDDRIKGNIIDIDRVDGSVRDLKTEVTGMGGNPQQTEALMKRIETLEQQVQTLQGKAAAAGKPAAEATKKGDAATKPEATPKSTGSSKSPAAGKTPASAKPSPAAGADSGASPKGKYYTIQAGDTLQSLAQQHGTTAAKISQANSLPANASLMPGNQIFIPNP